MTRLGTPELLAWSGDLVDRMYELLFAGDEACDDVDVEFDVLAVFFEVLQEELDARVGVSV